MQNRKRSGWGWFWQSVTGVALIGLLGLHMVAHHFVAAGGLRDYQQVIEYLSNPLIVVTEIAFLIVVTIHAMLGVRALLFDLGLTARAERMVTALVIGVGALTILFGFWLTYTVTMQGSMLTALLAP
ncbi:MAG: hypothetical protein IT331_16655 [Anaerolineae bacterium]|nr:hypothetical protein [Anaerolineae bacterium]